jgi:hypothetical protein
MCLGLVERVFIGHVHLFNSCLVSVFFEWHVVATAVFIGIHESQVVIQKGKLINVFV